MKEVDERLHHGGVLAVAAAVLLALAPSLARADTPERVDPGDSVELEPLVITEPVAPLDRELQRLRLMLDASTPCLGCEAESAPTRENVVMGLIRFMLFPAEPPVRDEAGRTLGAVRCGQAGPGMEYRCP